MKVLNALSSFAVVVGLASLNACVLPQIPTQGGSQQTLPGASASQTSP